jgi:hypothetical protein
MTTRLRKVACPDCGYTIRVTRSWMQKGLPACPCGQSMRPESGADLAFLGLLNHEDVPDTMWTTICRENGWEDSIIRRGNAAKAYEQRVASTNGTMGRPGGAGHCVYPGCGLWIKAGADHCSKGHAQREGAELAAMPF